MMTNNAARRPQPAAEVQRGIHLVYSRDWKQERPVEIPRPAKRRSLRQIRRRRELVTMAIASAAALGPLVWAGHALLHSMHVL